MATATVSPSLSVSRVAVAVMRHDMVEPGAVQEKVAVPFGRSSEVLVLAPPQPSVRLTSPPESAGMASKLTLAVSTEFGGIAGRQLASEVLRATEQYNPAPDNVICPT